MRSILSFIVVIPSLLVTHTNAYTLYLDNGFFYGPGDALYLDTGKPGLNKFPDAQVRNIVLTGPLSGIIPFDNNGADAPNVIAEQLSLSGPVDGRLSDGTLINENADTALRLFITDLVSGEIADLVVIAEASERPDGGEPILADAVGNLTFNPSVVADPGEPELISRFNVSFTTGLGQVPLSYKTQQGLAGGVDAAGPLVSGTVLIGKLGDYDGDGFMDGELILTANSPSDLIVARGNPIAQRRPWTSDIPIEPQQAIFLTLTNLLNNYPFALKQAQDTGDAMSIVSHLDNFGLALKAILGNTRAIANTPALANNLLARSMMTEIRKDIERLEKHNINIISSIDLSGLKYHRRNRDATIREEKIAEKTLNLLTELQSVSNKIFELNRVMNWNYIHNFSLPEG